MTHETYIWLELLSSLHKGRLRKAATAEGMQLIHFEILNYLDIANRYSNTAQALSEYLGQTKGSISQSLKLMEKSGYIEKSPCTKDGRITRLFLTDKGRASLTRMDRESQDGPAAAPEPFQEFLRELQKANGHNGFGQCRFCRHNQELSKGTFLCGLTNEPLSKIDTNRICKEFA